MEVRGTQNKTGAGVTGRVRTFWEREDEYANERETGARGACGSAPGQWYGNGAGTCGGDSLSLALEVAIVLR